MDEKLCSHRQTPSDRQDFPARTHPNRPHESGNESDSRLERDDHGYPESCNPRRTGAPLDEDQQSLATRFLPLARSMANRMKDSCPAAGDELLSVAFLALVESAQHFDSARGVSFSTFARHRIWGALCDLRSEIIQRRRPGKPGAEVAAVRLGKDTYIEGRIIGSTPPKSVGSDLESLDTFENWLRQLPRLQAQAFRHIYVDGKTQAEAAVLVGCSKWAMHRMHTDGIKSLQQIFEYERAKAHFKKEK